MRRGRQMPMFCPCGAAFPARAGMCRACYRSRQHSRTHFGGHREAVLTRDQGVCQLCGTQPDHPHVHHRVPGDHDQTQLVTLCAACHTRLHKLRTLRRWAPNHFVGLWVEQHPDVPLQLQFALDEKALSAVK